MFPSPLCWAFPCVGFCPFVVYPWLPPFLFTPPVHPVIVCVRSMGVVSLFVWSLGPMHAGHLLPDTTPA